MVCAREANTDAAPRSPPVLLENIMNSVSHYLHVGSYMQSPAPSPRASFTRHSIIGAGAETVTTGTPSHQGHSRVTSINTMQREHMEVNMSPQAGEQGWHISGFSEEHAAAHADTDTALSSASSPSTADANAAIARRKDRLLEAGQIVRLYHSELAGFLGASSNPTKPIPYLIPHSVKADRQCNVTSKTLFVVESPNAMTGG